MSTYDKVYDLVTKPLAALAVKSIPFRLHPNVYTWAGFVACLLSAFIVFSHHPDDFDRLHWLLLAVAILIYNIMDAMDGIVARLEGIPSCEGEMLDHMIDAVCTVLPLACGWVHGSALVMSRRMYVGHSVFLFAHMHHRFSGGPLIQGICGFGVDAAAFLGAFLSIIWSFYPLETTLFGRFYLFFVIEGIDILALIGLLYFSYLLLNIFIQKSEEQGCAEWEMINEDLVLWLIFATLGYSSSPIHTSGLQTLSYQFIAICFTMSLFFYRTLYRKLSSQPKNKYFASNHYIHFIFVGYINRIIVLLQIFSILNISFFIQNRDIIFMFQAILACFTSIFTLLTIHYKGPKLPKERPENRIKSG